MIQRLRLLGENLRRILMRVLLGVAIFLITALLLAPEAVGEAVQTIPGMLRFLVAGIIVLVTAGTLYYRYQHHGQDSAVEGLVVHGGGAVTGISVESAQEMVHTAIMAVPGVISADVDLQEKRGKAVIAQSIVIRGDAGSLADQQKAIDQALRKVLHKQLNVRLAEQPVTQIRMTNDSSARPAPVAKVPEPVTKAPEPVVASKPAEKPQADVPEKKPDAEKKSGNPLGGLLGRREKDDSKKDETGEFWQFLESTAKEPDPEVAQALSVLSGDEKPSEVSATSTTDDPPIEDVEDDQTDSSTKSS